MPPKPANNKVKAPTAAQILAMEPQKAVDLYFGLPQPVKNKLTTAQRNAFTKQRDALDAPIKSYDVGYLSPEGMSLGGVRVEQGTNKPLGYVPGTRMFKDPYGEVLGAGGTLSGQYADTGREAVHPARYPTGSQLDPINKGTDYIMDLQQKLEKAGLLEPGTYTLGTWGATSAVAYAGALTDANVADKDVEEIIQQRIDHPQKKQDNRGPLVTTLTNPADIMAATKQAAQNLYGRNIELPQGVQDMLVSGLQETERQIQSQAYSLSDPNGPGGTMTDTPSPTAYAEQRLKQLYPGRETDDEFANAMSTIIGMMGE